MFVPKGLINNIPVLVQITALCLALVPSHCLNQWLVYWHIYVSLGLSALKTIPISWKNNSMCTGNRSSMCAREDHLPTWEAIPHIRSSHESSVHAINVHHKVVGDIVKVASELDLDLGSCLATVGFLHGNSSDNSSWVSVTCRRDDKYSSVWVSQHINPLCP